MRARSLKRQAADRAYEPVRQAILARDPQCIVCGSVATDVHHRRQRSLGGSNDPANLVGLCRADHDDIHHEGGHYYSLGLLLRSWESEETVCWNNFGGFWGVGVEDGWGGVVHPRWHLDAVRWLHERLDERARLFSLVHDSIPWSEETR